MKLIDHYDWVVLGDHPAALLSASLAARLGLSVLVLPLAPGLPVLLSASGQYLDPESNFMIGLGGMGRAEKPGGLLWECLARIGVLPSETEALRVEGVLPQVVTPFSRISLTDDDVQLQSELQREFGTEWDGKLGLVTALKRTEQEFLSFWLGLPERLTLSPGKGKKVQAPLNLKALKKKISQDRGLVGLPLRSWMKTEARVSDVAAELGRPEFGAACAGLGFGVTSEIREDLEVADFLHILALARTGGSFRGGMSSYRDFLLRVARRLGVHVPEKADCRRIFLENGRFVGVQISHRGNMIGASGGILGCSMGQAERMISVSGRSWFRKIKKSTGTSGWKFSIALTVNQEALPPGMSKRLVWQEEGAPSLEFEVADPADYGSSDLDCRFVFVRTIMPFTEQSLDPAFQRLIAGRMLRQLVNVLPFLEFHVTRIYPDFRRQDEAGTGEIQEVYPFKTLEEIPDNLICHSGAGIGSRSGIDGLFVASSESFPELGSLGGTVAAIESVAWLAHRAGLAGPLV